MPAIVEELTVATDVEKIVLAATRPTDELAEYEAIGGYEALAKARAMTPTEVTDELIASELRGRGGAFFPTGRKWSFVPSKEQLPKPHYLVVNADESEPGSFKDNEILSRVPHRFIEGCLITAHAIDCKQRLRLHPRRVLRAVRDPRRARSSSCRTGPSCAAT